MNDMLKPIYETRLGKYYLGNSIERLRSKFIKRWYKGKVQLIITSPPFPLNQKKKYGNLQGVDLVTEDGLAPQMRQVILNEVKFV